MEPAIVKDIDPVRRHVGDARRRGKLIGLVPTMGALHAGHISLIRAARNECGYVAVSIFVNPTQFGPSEDLSRYPRPFEHDVAVCRDEGVELIFAPEPLTMYPASFCTYVDVHGLQDTLCGASRPGHFRGVVTVVLKLFHIVQPDVAYFGQKDAQQARIIEQMVRDLDVPIRLRICPIVREPNGLALSSRNQYLDADQRKNAVVLHRSLHKAKALIASGERDAAIVRQTLAAPILATPGAVLDYAELVDAESLRPLSRLTGRVLIAVAVRFGQTRLIDNELIEL
jgi:pantoate--beta-alanine ligase